MAEASKLVNRTSIVHEVTIKSLYSESNSLRQEMTGVLTDLIPEKTLCQELNGKATSASEATTLQDHMQEVNQMELLQSAHIAAGRSFTIDNGFDETFLEELDELRKSLPLAKVLFE